MTMRRNALLVGLAVAVLTTSGCGGGGGGGSSVETSETRVVPPVVRVGTGTEPAPATEPEPAPPTEPPVRTAAEKAAGNTPNSGSGSVTQSSTGAGGVTADSVSVSVERYADGTINYTDYTVREAGGWSVDTASASIATLRGGWKVGEGWEGVEFHQAPGGGRGRGTGPGLYVRVYTDIEAPRRVTTPSRCGVGGAVSAGNSCTYEVGSRTYTLNMRGSTVCFVGSGITNCAGGNINMPNVTINGVTYTMVTEGSGTSRRIARLSPNLAAAAGGGSTELVQDADYLARGVWVRVPADGYAASLADYEFGAFADGADPFRQTNLAGLTGAATYTGEATAQHSHRETNTNYLVAADVTLTARFGDVRGLGSIGGAVSNIRGEQPGPGAYDGVVITLGTAPIGSADSGFFTGATSSSGTDSPFTGKWGGQFYGNGAAGDRPGSVAGTFSAATADGGEAFVGAYTAHGER